MYKKILVAMDMSEMSKEVFAQALAVAQQGNTSLLLLHVLSPEEDNSPLPIPPDLTDLYPAVGNDLTLEAWREQWEQFEKQGLEMLRSHAEEAASVGVNAEVTQISGPPGKSICKLAQDQQADLIVIGRRGRSGFREIFLGSVSNYVLHHAPGSVLIVQSKAVTEVAK